MQHEIFNKKIIDKNVILVVHDIDDKIQSFSFSENESLVIILNNALIWPLK